MASWRALESCAVGVILLAILSSGLAGGGVGELTPATLDDGTAEITVENLPVERLHVDEGRFGTSVLYLRIPDVKVRVSTLEGTPRVNYRVTIPALDVAQSSTRLLTDPGQRTVTVSGVDRAFDPESITKDRYIATISVSVQSFAVDRTVRSVNETVEVNR